MQSRHVLLDYSKDVLREIELTLQLSKEIFESEGHYVVRRTTGISLDYHILIGVFLP